MLFFSLENLFLDKSTSLQHNLILGILSEILIFINGDSRLLFIKYLYKYLNIYINI